MAVNANNVEASLTLLFCLISDLVLTSTLFYLGRWTFPNYFNRGWNLDFLDEISKAESPCLSLRQLFT